MIVQLVNVNHLDVGAFNPEPERIGRALLKIIVSTIPDSLAGSLKLLR